MAVSFNYRIDWKFHKRFGNIAAELPVVFQSDRTIVNTNLVALQLNEI